MAAASRSSQRRRTEGSATARRGAPRIRQLWWARDRDRIIFELGAHELGCRVSHVHGIGRVYELTVDVPHYGPHAVTILFRNDSPDTPRVSVTTPASSPHRFHDNTLCMWFSGDDNKNKWLRRDGLLALVGHISTHLFRENWWHEYGEWLGDEIAHPTMTKDVARAS